MNTKNLCSYKENGYNHNYIVILDGHSANPDFKVFKTRPAAEQFNEEKLDGHGDVLTFRQAAKEYPENFKF